MEKVRLRLGCCCSLFSSLMFLAPFVINNTLLLSVKEKANLIDQLYVGNWIEVVAASRRVFPPS
jgi:hypothetical protein